MYEEIQPGHREVGVAARLQYGPVGLAVAGRHVSGSLPLSLAVRKETIRCIFTWCML